MSEEQIAAFNAQQTELQRQRALLGDDAARLAGQLAIAHHQIRGLLLRVGELETELSEARAKLPPEEN